MYAIWTLIFSLYHVYHNDYEAKKFTSCIQHLKMEFNEMSKLHDCHYNLLNTNSFQVGVKRDGYNIQYFRVLIA